MAKVLVPELRYGDNGEIYVVNRYGFPMIQGFIGYNLASNDAQILYNNLGIVKYLSSDIIVPYRFEYGKNYEIFFIPLNGDMWGYYESRQVAYVYSDNVPLSTMGFIQENHISSLCEEQNAYGLRIMGTHSEDLLVIIHDSETYANCLEPHLFGKYNKYSTTVINYYQNIVTLTNYRLGINIDKSNFNIEFYKNIAENIRLDKTDFLQNKFVITGSLRNNCSIINPSIIIEDFDVNGAFDIRDYNYCYISKFKRYYYIEDIISICTGLWEIELECDVLMSFKTEILDLFVFAARNQYDFDTTIIDNRIPAKSDLKRTIIKTPTTPFSIYNQESADKNKCPFVLSGSILETSINSSILSNNAALNGGMVTIGNNLLACNGTFLHQFFKWITDTSFNIDEIANIFKTEPSKIVQTILYFPFDVKVYSPFMPANISPENKITVNFMGNTKNFDAYYFGSSERNTYLYMRDYKSDFANIAKINVPILSNVGEYLSDIDFINYRPFTTVKLYIPFYGLIEIEPDLLKGTMYLDYSIDLYTGRFICKLYSSLHDSYVYIVNGNCGYEIPLTITNKNERTRNIIMAGINAASFIVSGGYMSERSIGGGSSVQTKKFNYSKTKNRRTSIKTTTEYIPAEKEQYIDKGKISNFVSDSTIDFMSAMVERNYSGSISSELNVFGDIEMYKPYILIERVNYYIPDRFNELVGRPTTYSGLLKNLHGYTEIGGVHIEYMDIATNQERDEIENILKTGVILPNSPSNSINSDSSGG